MKKIFLKFTIMITILSLVFSYWTQIIPTPRAMAISSGGKYPIIDEGDSVNDIAINKIIGGTGKTFYLTYDYFKGSGLLSALDNYTQDLVRAGYDGRVKIEAVGLDKANIKKWDDIQKALYANFSQAVQHAKNSWYIPAEFSKVPLPDKKIIDTLYTVTDPKILGGYDNWPIGLNRINKGHACTKDHCIYTDESALADPEDQRTPSPHNSDRSQATDWDSNGQIKCTLVVCDDENDPNNGHHGNDDGRCQKNEFTQSPQAEKPVSIDFKNILQNPKDPSDQLNSDSNQNIASAIGTGNSLADYLKNPKKTLYNFLAQAAGLDSSQNIISHDSAKVPDSAVGAAAIIGDNIMQTQMGLDNTVDSFYSSFSEMITGRGQQVLSKDIFGGKLSPESFQGADGYVWLSNIASLSLENRVDLPSDSLKPGDSNTLVTIGQRVMEDIQGLKPGALAQTATNYDQLVKQIGPGYMEKNLYLPAGSLASDNANEVKKQIGEDKYQAIFSTANASIIANTLLLDQATFVANLNDFAQLKKLVGEKVLDQNIRIYQPYTFTDQEGKTIGPLGSQDEMFNFLNYKKPEVDFTNNTIKTYNLNTGTTEEITFIGDPSNPGSYTYTYEKLLADLQEQNSLTRKFLSGDKLADTYKNIGAIRVAKGLSSVEDEQLAIYQFLTTGIVPQTSVKYNDQISAEVNAFDPQEVAQRIGLDDWYDLYKIFIKNRGEEIYPYLGMEVISQTLNSSADTSQLNNIDTSGTAAIDQATEFISDQLDQIKTASQSFSQGIQDDIVSHLNNAQNQLNTDNQGDLSNIVTNPPQKKVSSSLTKIGQILKQNNLQNTQEAKDIYQYIYQINRGSALSNWQVDASKLTSSSNFGLTSQILENFFNQDLQDLNIDQLVTKAAAGALLYGLDLDQEFSDADATVNSINSNIASKNIDPISAIINGFGKDNLAHLAEILNISLTLPNDNKLSSQDIAQILNGNMMTMVNKISNKPISDGLGISFWDLISGKTDLANSLSDDVFSYFDIPSQNISDVRNLLTSMGSPNFISQTIDTGFNSLFNLMDTSQIQNMPQATQILNQFKDYLKGGVQSLKAVKDLQNLSTTIGQFIPQSLMKGDFTGVLKELSSINLFNSLKSEGIDLTQIRIFSGLKLPDLTGINKWVSDNFGSMGEKLGTVYSQLHKLGIDTLIQSNGQNINYAYMDNMIRTNIDKNIPVGFSRAMLSGDQSSLLSISAEWIKNSIKNPTEAETTALNALSNVLAGNMSASSITSASMDIIFANKSFKTSLENAGISQSTFTSLLSSVATGTLDQNTAISISKQILLKNLSNNGATAKDLSTISAGLDLLSGDITAQKGVNAVMNVLSQDEKFKNSLKNAGLTTDMVQNLINSGLSGNFSQSQAISTLKEVTLANMKKSLEKETDPNKIKIGQQNISMIESAMDILNSGGSKESIATAMTNYISKNPDFVKSLTDAGISSGTASSLISSAINGNFNQGQAVTVLKDVVTNNMKTSLAKETDPNKIKTGQQNISIVEGAMDILNGNATPQSITTAGLTILNKNDTFKNSLKNAGITESSFNSLVSAAVSGNISQGQAISVAKDIILNKIKGVQSKEVAGQVLNILSSGGSFNASNITSIITTAFGDKIDVMFKGMDVAPGGGAQILGALASGNVQGAAGAIIGAKLDKALTSAMDKITKTATGTTEAIRNANILAGQNEMEQMESITKQDKTGFLNFKEIGKMITNAALEMAKSLITAYATSLLVQTGIMDERTAKAFMDALVLIATGTNPVLAIASLAHDFFHISIPGLSILGLGGGGKIIKEVYCAMDYYPWLQDDYPHFKPDEIYKGIYYWPNTTSDVSGSTQLAIVPADKNDQGFAQEIPKPDRIGENLPDRPVYEFKATPSSWTSVVQKKLPAAAYLKTTQLVWDFVDLPTHFNDLEKRASQVMVPLWPSTLVAITDKEVLDNQSDPEKFEGLGGEILNKFMHALDLIYGNRVYDANTNKTDEIVPGFTMKERLLSGDNKEGFSPRKELSYWVHLTW